MKVNIVDKDLEELILLHKNRKYKRIERSKKLMEGLSRTYKILCEVADIKSLKNFSILHYEKLKYNYKGKSSVRINTGSVERLIFTEKENGIEINLIELEDNHYGNKK